MSSRSYREIAGSVRDAIREVRTTDMRNQNGQVKRAHVEDVCLRHEVNPNHVIRVIDWDTD